VAWKQIKARTALAMTVLRKPDRLFVGVYRDEILVTGRGFYAAYAKPKDKPQLLLTRRTDTEDHVLLAQAWQAASDKARKLGWIV
jgi:hypothetical protein